MKKMNDELKVPVLRFSGFSGEWEEKKLGKICVMTSSKRIYLSDYVKKGIPFYRGKEISELKRNKTPTDILYISNERYLECLSKYGVPQIDDILITAVGTLGNVLRIKNNNKFYFKDGNLIWLKKITEHSNFIEILLEFNKRKLLKTSIGSTQKALTMVELRKIKLCFPQLPEQTKIANFLTSIDERIEQLTRKKDLLKQYKKGVMQQLFAQEIRFKDEEGKDFVDWEEKELGKIGTFKTSSVDKKIVEGEKIINLVNYMNVYRHENITNKNTSNLMKVSANENQLKTNNLNTV